MASLARTVPSLARTVPSLARTVLKPSVLPQRGTRRQRQLVLRMGWIEEKIGRMGWNGSTEIRKEMSLNLTMDQFWQLNWT